MESSFAGKDGPMHLSAVVLEIIIAGTETTSTLIEWVLLYLLSRPDIQEKMAEEIQLATGGRPISLEDKENTPYCNSVLEEVSRFCPGKNVFFIPFFLNKIFFKGFHSILPNIRTTLRLNDLF